MSSEEKNNFPIFLVCKAIPFDGGGSATVIRNLIINSKEGQFFVLGREPKTTIDFKNLNLPFKYATIPLSDKPSSIINKIYLFIKSLFKAFNYLKLSKAQCIVGVYRDETSLLLSYFLSIFTGRKLYVYLTDLYAENYQSKTKVFFQKIIFKRAKKVLCLNEGMKQVYKDLYDIDAMVIPNCVNVKQASFTENKIPSKPFKILFSGTILFDRLDLLQNLVKEFKDNPDFEIHFLSSNDSAYLKNNNLIASNVFCNYYTDTDKMFNALKEADLLYLPLTFKKPDDKRSLLQLTSCLATKSFDYMQTCKPILVHCPSEYFTYKYFESRNAAILLDKQEGLYELINEIKDKYASFSKISLNALQSLKQNNSQLILEKFLTTVN